MDPDLRKIHSFNRHDFSDQTVSALVLCYIAVLYKRPAQLDRN